MLNQAAAAADAQPLPPRVTCESQVTSYNVPPPGWSTRRAPRLEGALRYTLLQAITYSEDPLCSDLPQNACAREAVTLALPAVTGNGTRGEQLVSCS